MLFAFLPARLFGREFADRTVRALLAIPTPRSAGNSSMQDASSDGVTTPSLRPFPYAAMPKGYPAHPLLAPAVQPRGRGPQLATRTCHRA